MPVIRIRRRPEVRVRFEMHDGLREGGLAVEDSAGVAEYRDDVCILRGIVPSD